jgi:protein involved in polysaccharide export with SLBB domain
MSARALLSLNAIPVPASGFAGYAAISRYRQLLVSATARIVATLALWVSLAPALAQVPIPMREQVQLFNSLPPAQQQALIRELQRQLPPAQREAIVNMLRGTGDPAAAEDVDPEAREVLDEVLGGQAEEDGVQREEEEPRLRPRDTMVIEFLPRVDAAGNVVVVPPEEQARIDEFRDRLERGNPYQLDGSGTLYMPGVSAIELAGLNVDQATVRVNAATELRPFSVIITFLPLEPPLQTFGYSLFEQRGAFARASDISVPVDYVVGPGDTVNVQLFGSENAEYFLAVSREGTINFPEIGPISVLGLSFAELRDTINERVAQQMIGVRASVTLGDLRSIQVFVLGDVRRPGSYTVNGLATITNALFASGGVEPIGSLRNITLRRGTDVVTTLDLYDLLLRGDTSDDVRLQAGDAIFVPPVGPTITIDGEVRRPAIYEVRNEQSVGALLALAGGASANADRRAVKLERVVAGRGRTVRDLDVSSNDVQVGVQDGDVLRVLSTLDQL